MRIGDQVSFGKYEWLVLAVEQDKALLMSKDIVELRDYHCKNEAVTWKDCELRHYLNGAFYDNFTQAEKDSICKALNVNLGNDWYGVDGGEDTTDYVFILSMQEAVKVYLGDSSRLLDFPKKNQRYWFDRKDENNPRRRAKYLESSWWWWVRTPGKHQRVAVYIHGDGNIGIQGNGVSKRNTNVIHPVANSTKGGIRPVLWLKTNE